MPILPSGQDIQVSFMPLTFLEKFRSGPERDAELLAIHAPRDIYFLTPSPIFRLFCFFVALLAGPSLASTFTGVVVGVADGDTITVLDSDNRQIKVRLAGIDAPEKKQAFGAQSKIHLSELVYKRTVTLECGKQDRYRRHVCIVMRDGRDMNLLQVKAGLAWWYRKYSPEQRPSDRLSYEESESKARAARIGLWADINPATPWDFRKIGKMTVGK